MSRAAGGHIPNRNARRSRRDHARLCRAAGSAGGASEQCGTSAGPGMVVRGAGTAVARADALGTIEALKSAVASNLGMAIVPEVAVAMHMSDFIVRPLRPPLPRTLALIEHRNKPNDPALTIVRNALLTLQTVATVQPAAAKRRQKKRARGAGASA